MSMIHKITDKAWGDCIALQNDQVELLIPLSVGPRIVRYAFRGGINPFNEYPFQLKETNREKWYSYGGHRLWHAPEDAVRTYIPDNEPIRVETCGEALRLVQKIEPITQIQKEMDVTLDSSGSHVRVVHHMRNHSLWDIRLALWAVSVMAPGGKAILPLPPRGGHESNLLAQTSLNLWAYTDMQDPRWTFGQKFITLRQDPESASAQKMGIAQSGGWVAYVNHGQAFITRSKYQPDQVYPDRGSHFELYTDKKCTEVEALSPFVTLAPGSAAEFVEDWNLIDQVGECGTEEEIERQFAAVG
jgi:hypothetical protein